MRRGAFVEVAVEAALEAWEPVSPKARAARLRRRTAAGLVWPLCSASWEPAEEGRWWWEEDEAKGLDEWRGMKSEGLRLGEEGRRPLSASVGG
jgi:hypothetical protein